MKDPYGLKKLGVEHVRPYSTRGILRLKGATGSPGRPPAIR